MVTRPTVSKIFWKLVRNANSQAIPDLLNYELWGWGLAVCCLTGPPGGSDTGQRFSKPLPLNINWEKLGHMVPRTWNVL